MSPAIRVESLSKSYIIGHQGHRTYVTLRDELSARMRAIGNRILRRAGEETDGPTREEFWALKDVSFDVHPGDRLGIIGRNGAGKSTLLKVLSRITEPTTGRAEITGRVASLLEVGTGFHPELTGRENIFLNGAILGMTRAEIRARFDEIVDFAEVERFLDTAVKHYSSGMYVRLAFSVAAHLECDLLIVDEVLSVGDAVFQKKCLGKLEGMTGSGRTVLFVSHNMEIIQRLCNRALLLEAGEVKAFDSDVRSVINTYLARLQESGSGAVWENSGRQFDNPWFLPTRMSLTGENGRPVDQPVRNDTEMWVEIEGHVAKPDSALQIGYQVFDENGAAVYVTAHTDGDEAGWVRPVPGKNILRGRIPAHFLNEGLYRIEPLVALYWGHWIVRPGVNAPGIQLQIEGGLSNSPQWVVRRAGAVAPILEWRLR